MIDENRQKKISLIEKCMPAESLIDYGGMWGVDGLYSRIAYQTYGVQHVTMIDANESENWRTKAELREGVSFKQGSFTDVVFMDTIKEMFEVGLAYDILLHQTDLPYTLSLLLSKVAQKFVIAQPVLLDDDMRLQNSIVWLSGCNAGDDLFPNQSSIQDLGCANFRDGTRLTLRGQRSSELWLWGMTPSFLESLMAAFGWKLTHKELWKGWIAPESRWTMAGLIFERT